MGQKTIAEAIGRLELLYAALVSAYWDSNSVFQKDSVFDMVSMITAELNELNKLSIEDHAMAYEAVTKEVSTCARKLAVLKNNIDDWFPRTSTALALSSALKSAEDLLESSGPR